MNSSCVDLVILGGGCAGLSLARYLSQEPGWNQQTLIIEPRTAYLNDRSWCFWEPSDLALQTQLAPLIRQRWQQWRFSSSAFTQVQRAEGRGYCYVPAENFYRAALSAIQGSSSLTLQTGQSVLSVARQQRGFLLTLSDGSELNARQVIDTRPPVYHHANQARLWQIFYGYEIETCEAVFDQSTVGLMEHLTATAKALQFVYVLPFSDRHALIEITEFSRELIPPETLNAALQHYLEQSLGAGNFTIIRHEAGCLPMGLRQPATSTLADYHYAGTNAGAIRPATGYAFIRIQQWARQCARQLTQDKKTKITMPTAHITNAMDSIFLRVLHDTPAMGPALFQALAECVSGPALVRFLMDEATFKDYCQIVTAFPAWRFLIYGLGLNSFIYSAVDP